jgi:hypothetical protein
MSVHSYPTVFAIGHRAIADLFNGYVLVEEKVDGSQFSFGIIDGELQCRSKGKQLILDAPEKMFVAAVAFVRSIEGILTPDWTYRGEYLQKPKHNTLCYSRTPRNHIIGFDVMTAPEQYLSPEEKQAEFNRIGLECVPAFYSGKIENAEMFNSFLERESVLGGTKIEGVVVKNYDVFTMEKKVAMGKYVSEAFKEVHQKEWRTSNPTNADIVTLLISEYGTPARYQKAVQHLRENGTLDYSLKDIGGLIKEVSADVEKECKEEIKEKLYNAFWEHIQRGVVSGVPQWYKDELAKSAFEAKA